MGAQAADPPESDPDIYNMAIEIQFRGQAHAHLCMFADRPEVLMQSTESPVYCRTCQFWLNGRQQWKDHLIGNKHTNNLQHKRDFKLRIPYLACSKATIHPLTVWLVEQEQQIRELVRLEEQKYVRMLLRTVVKAWFDFVFVGNDSEYDVTDFLLDIDDAP